MSSISNSICFEVSQEYSNFELSVNDLEFRIQDDTALSNCFVGGSNMIQLATRNTSYAITQGDSLRLLVSCPEIGVFGQDWEGTWGVKNYKGQAEPVSQDQFDFSTDRKYMVANLSPEKTKLLTPGEYDLILAVENKTEQFRKQILSAKLTVTASELPLE